MFKNCIKNAIKSSNNSEMTMKRLSSHQGVRWFTSMSFLDNLTKSPSSTFKFINSPLLYSNLAFKNKIFICILDI